MAAVLLALPLLYVASSGPVLRFVYRSKTRYTSAGKAYLPLFQIAAATHLEPALRAYLWTWDVITFDPGDGSRAIVPEEYVGVVRDRIKHGLVKH